MATAAQRDASAVNVLSMQGVTKVYGSGPAAVHALRGVDLDLHEAEPMVLLGR